MTMRTRLILGLLAGMTLGAVAAEREEISLAGEWAFELDGANIGFRSNWVGRALCDTIALPGTTDLAKKGDGKVFGVATERIHPQLVGLQNVNSLTMHALRRHPFVGTAWYRREVDFPEAWSNRSVSVFLERTKVTTLFVDGERIGTRHSLVAPQEFELPAKYRTGRHTLTLAVDNRIDSIPVAGHQVSDDTQTNWNGVIGELKAVARDLVSVERVRITPHSAARTADVEIVLRNRSLRPASGVAEVSCSNGAVRARFAGLMSGDRVRVGVAFPKDAALWDEFTPALHDLRVAIRGEGFADGVDVRFGFCEYRTNGRQFTVNGKPVFLRGRHDACVWPKTGCPPMDRESWLGYFRILKSYGLNHVRGHTWCFPRAAFEAADETGFYLQSEFAGFGGGEFKTSELKRLYALAEARRQSDFYGNSPSFAMWTFANEPCGSAATLGEMVSEIRTYDPRRLYAQASNGDFCAPFGFHQNPGDDFWSTFRTAAGTEGDVRGSFASCDLPLGRVQTGPADTLGDYTRALKYATVPLIGHETGQYQTYPDFRDIDRYDGVLRALNLEIFRDRVEKAGLLKLAPAFFRDSAALQAINYREEIEEAIRTPGFGGFQLLDLQDFPGQGTALVGILNVFMEPKGAVTPERWRQWCAPTVLLARFPKYVYRGGEAFAAKVQCAHYGPEDRLAGEIAWRLEGPDGVVCREGRLPVSVARGEVATATGEAAFALPEVSRAGRYVLRLAFDGRVERNDYGIWVYPPADLRGRGKVVTVRSIEEGRKLTRKGKRVLCILDRTAFPTNGVTGLFASDFWCYPMFRRICESVKCPVAPGTLGLSMDPGHPALKGFPTATHSDYQWFDIVANSVSIPLEEMSGAPMPIVRTIDNVERNHRLALVYEQVDRAGRMVVCGSDLVALKGNPAADQLHTSLLRYLEGDESFRE